MYNMIELKEFNPLSMTEKTRSRATQEQENYSVLSADNDLELGYILTQLDSKVGLLTNSEEAKSLVIKDTRTELEVLLSKIAGQTETIDSIRTKQTELENEISNLIDLKKSFNEDVNESYKVRISAEIKESELRILTITNQIENLTKISKIFSATVEEQESEEKQEEIQRIQEELLNENQRQRLISTFENSYITYLIPIDESYRVKVVELLKSEDFKADKLVILIKEALNHYETRVEKGMLYRIIQKTGVNELIGSIKENIFTFLTTILRFDIAITADSSFSAISSLAIEFTNSVTSLAQQDDIENRILYRQQESINNQILRINPKATTLTLNQIRKLTSLQLRDIQTYCQSHANNTACLVIKRMIEENKEGIHKRIIERIKQTDSYTEKQKSMMISKIQSGKFEYNLLRFSTLLAYTDNKEDGQFWDQMRGLSVRSAVNVGKLYARTIRIGEVASEYATMNMPNKSNLGDLTRKPLSPKSMEAHKLLIDDLEKSINGAATRNTADARHLIERNINKCAEYKVRLEKALANARNAKTPNKELIQELERRLISLHQNLTRLVGAKYAAIGDYVEKGRAGGRLERASGQASLFKRTLGKTGAAVASVGKWAFWNTLFVGGVQAYDAITGKISTEDALRNTGAGLKYCIPIVGSYYRWRDYAENPTKTGFALAACQTILEVPVLPIGYIAKLMLGLQNVTKLNTFFRAAKSIAAGTLISATGGSLIMDYMLQQNAGTTAGATFRNSCKVLGIVSETNDYLDMTPLEKLEDDVMTRLATQTQIFNAIESKEPALMSQETPELNYTPSL